MKKLTRKVNMEKTFICRKKFIHYASLHAKMKIRWALKQIILKAQYQVCFINSPWIDKMDLDYL